MSNEKGKKKNSLFFSLTIITKNFYLSKTAFLVYKVFGSCRLKNIAVPSLNLMNLGFLKIILDFFGKIRGLSQMF